MTTLTILPAGEEAVTSISVNAANTINEINPLIYGGFTECVIHPWPSRLILLTLTGSLQTHGPLHLRRAVRAR